MNYIQKEKHIFILVVAVSIILFLFLYCKPMQLSKVLDADATVTYFHAELGVIDGAAYIDNSNVLTLSPKECEQLADIFSGYTYVRSLQTLFVDDSMLNLGREVIYLYIYQNNELITSIVIPNSEVISINQTVYAISNDVALINEVKEVCDK